VTSIVVVVAGRCEGRGADDALPVARADWRPARSPTAHLATTRTRQRFMYDEEEHSNKPAMVSLTFAYTAAIVSAAVVRGWRSSHLLHSAVWNDVGLRPRAAWNDRAPDHLALLPIRRRRPRQTIPPTNLLIVAMADPVPSRRRPLPTDPTLSAPSAFGALLALPYTLVTSPSLQLLLLRSLLVVLLLGAAAGLSSTSYFVLYFTWGRVPSFSAPLALTYGSPGHPPHATVVLPAAGHWRPKQAYDLFVELDCPLTAANVHLGNFMVGIDVLSASSGSKLSTSSPLYSATRSSLLTPPPILSPANMLPLFWGTPTRTIRLPLLTNVLLDDGRGQRAGRVTVWVGREDGWRGADADGGGRELHTTGGRLVIRGRLSGLRCACPLSEASEHGGVLTAFLTARVHPFDGSSLLNNHPLLSLSALTSVSLLTTLLASLLSFYLFSPTFRLRAAQSKPAASVDKGGAGRLRSSARERAWAATLPRSMDAITGDVSGTEDEGSTASSLLGPSAAEDEEEEADLARLRAKEAEVRRVRAELELAEEREADLEAAREREERAAAAAAAAAAARSEKGDQAEDGTESLLGGVSPASCPPRRPLKLVELNLPRLPACCSLGRRPATGALARRRPRARQPRPQPLRRPPAACARARARRIREAPRSTLVRRSSPPPLCTPPSQSCLSHACSN